MPTEQQLINRRQWLDALRSGQYEQGEGALCRNNKYCCLGVDAEIAGKLVPVDNDSKAFSDPTQPGGLHSVAFPPQTWFAERHGLNEAHARNLRSNAADWNDHHRADFNEIAGRLEEAFSASDAEIAS